MRELAQALKKTPIIYVTRDLERALGLPLSTPGYFVITNDSPFARPIARRHKNILLIKAKEKLDTRELLEHAKTIKFIEGVSPKRRGVQLYAPTTDEYPISILVFKNTPQIEKICRDHNWYLLNPSAKLANRVEEKISQLEWFKLNKLDIYSLPMKTMLTTDLGRLNEPFSNDLANVVQFNRAHTGQGTVLIDTEEKLNKLKTKFPKRPIRVSKYTGGPIFTSNNVVWGNQVLVGNISYQITGLRPFTDQQFATIGNDWNLPQKLLSAKQIRQFKQIATDVGKKLAKDGWKGLFGIDVIMEEKTGKLYLLEINARQPASTTYESQLQQKKQETRNKKQITAFEAHLASLLDLQATSYKLQAISDGAQIIQRVTSSSYKLPARLAYGEAVAGGQATSYNLRNHFTLIPYTNTKPGEDLWRIQSKKGIMKNHKKFNKIGTIIENCLKIKN